MNFRTTILLAVVLLGALVFVYVANREPAPDPNAAKTTDEDATKGRKVLDLKADDVTKIVVRPTAAGAKPIELAKSGAKWDLVQPIAWPAESFEARGLVDAVADLRSRGSVELTGENAASTGLDKPRYEIELTDAAGKTHKLSVGERSAIGKDLYVKAGDAKTAMVVPGGTLLDRLGKGPEKLLASLRDKQLVRTPAADARQVEITHRGGRVVLQKEGNDWRVTEPAAVNADETEVSDLLFSLTGLRAEEYADAPAAGAPTDARFERPRATIWISTAAPATQPSATQPAAASAAITQPAAKTGGVTIVIGEPAELEGDKVWVSTSSPSPAIAKVSLNSTALDRITKASALTLRDRKVLDLNPDDVSEFTVSTDRPSTTQPSTRPAEQKQIRVARRKDTLELGPTLPGGPAGGGAAPASPTTGPTTGPATTPAAAAAASSATPSQAASTQPTESTAATAAPAATQSSSPATQPAAATQASTQPSTGAPAVTQPAGTAPTTQPGAAAAAPEPPKSKWVIESGGGTPADEGQVTKFLDDLHPLRALKYVERPAATTQPATGVTYVVTIRTVGAGGANAATHELRITDPGGSAVPVAQYRDLTFEVDRALVRKLEDDFKTRRADPTPPPSGMPPGFPGGGFPGGMPGGGLPPGHP